MGGRGITGGGPPTVTSCLPWLIVTSPPPVMPLPPIHQRFCLLLAGAFASRCTPILIAPLPLIHPHLASFPCIIIEHTGVHCARTSIFQMFQFRLAQKWDRCSPQRANCAKLRCALVADSVSRLMVRGWEHSTSGSGQTMVRSGRGPISHPIGQPSWS